jgi:Rad52/22 family double-strand break repair protein
MKSSFVKSAGAVAPMTQHPDLFAALAAPFDASELKLRSQAGRQMPYVTARTVMNRLDEVLGPENWWDDFVPLEHSVICRISIRLPDGTILTKCDAGGYAGLADPGDDDKSGFADAFKRTAVKFGVGRYLYRDGVPKFARDEPRDSARLEANSRAGEAKPPEIVPAASASTASPRSTEEGAGAPRTGRALFAWTKDHDGKFEHGLLKHLSAWAKGQEFPARMVDWDAEQVSQAYAEVRRRVRALQATGRRPEAVLSN